MLNAYIVNKYAYIWGEEATSPPSWIFGSEGVQNKLGWLRAGSKPMKEQFTIFLVFSLHFS
jgi:hypothetical protein